MAVPHGFLQIPAVHPRLLDADTLAELAATWQQTGRLRVTSVLRPGLAAELAPVLGRLPLTPLWDAGRRELSWRCIVVMPESVDPQYPECMFALLRFVSRDLPALATSITGRPLTPEQPSWIQVCALRKGGYIDARADSADRDVEAWLGLTGACWPGSFGGHLQVLGPHGDVIEERAPGWDTLDFVDTRRVRVPLVTRHVEALQVLCPLHGTDKDHHAAPEPGHG